MSMTVREKLGMQRVNTNICFECANACGGCSWSRDFEPVEGWTATPTKVKVCYVRKKVWEDTYKIDDCPEFVRG